VKDYHLSIERTPSPLKLEIHTELATIGAIAMDFLKPALLAQFGGRWSITYKGTPPAHIHKTGPRGETQSVIVKTNRPVRVYTICWNEPITEAVEQTVQDWISRVVEYLQRGWFFFQPSEEITQIPHGRTNPVTTEELYDLLSLVLKHPPALSYIGAWPAEQKAEAEQWAGREMLAASDCTLARIECPDCLRPYLAMSGTVQIEADAVEEDEGD
jgi:hypothetical protein